MQRIAWSLTLCATLSGCVSTKNVAVEPSAMEKLDQRTIMTSQRAKPDFSALKAGEAVMGPIGVALMISTGNKLIADNEIEDPAAWISQELLKDLVANYALRVVPNPGIVATGWDIGKLAAQHPQAHVLFDVETVNWSFVYLPFNWTHYRLIYGVKLRVIDTAQGKLLGEGFCGTRAPEETADAPTYDEMVADHGAWLKKQLRMAAENCVTNMRAQLTARKS